MIRRVSARALTRVLLAVLGAGCSTVPEGRVIAPREIVIGRAATSDSVVMLTSESALVYVTADHVSRVQLDAPPAKLWGLGSIGDDLYSIAGFIDLVRLTRDRHVQRIARFERPVANLVDLPDGMAAQPAVDHPGTPLVWRAGVTARLAPIEGATRRSLGLPRAEEGVLHLLSCSASSRIVCWLPGSDEVLALDEHGLRPLARLNDVRRIAPARLIAQPNRRAIYDAVAAGDSLLVLFDRDGRGEPALAQFDSGGTLVRWLHTPQRLRLLLDANATTLRAITVAGALVRVPL